MIKAGVIGATGYAGAELVRILMGHPRVTVNVITSRQYAGQPFSDVYPSMTGVCPLVCETWDEAATPAKAEIFFLALPHKIPMTIAPVLLDAGCKVVDLSADFRFSNRALYEQWYQPHTAAHLLEEKVYGLTEVYRETVAGAHLIGNPGCYPTSILLPLLPLLKRGLILKEGLIADSKSGVSGAGRSASLATHFCEVDESFKAYKVNGHRHNPEIDEILSIDGNAGDLHLTFVPHLVPMIRGMLSTVYATAADGVTADTLRGCLSDYYHDSPFVRICPSGRMPDTRYVSGTNFCDIGVHVDPQHQRVVLVSAIDNLVKGAAGQAVQNMNIMLGFDETAGLDIVPRPV